MNKKEQIVDSLAWLVNELTMPFEYKWDADYSSEHSKKKFEKFYNHMKTLIDFNNMSTELADMLRMRIWDDYDENNTLWLFPLYLTPIIPEGMIVVGIDGSKVPYKKGQMDNDVRYGCVAYGILIPKKKENKDEI